MSRDNTDSYIAAYIEDRLLSLLSGEFSSLTIRYNDHAVNYIHAKQAIEDDFYDFVDWVSEEQKATAKATNSVWILQWYPDTPIGFNAVAAASLDGVLSAIKNKVQP